MEKIVIGIAVTGGEGPRNGALTAICARADIIAAADSGLAAVEEAGLSPDWIVGDMDSLDDPERLKKYPPERVIRYPGDKDFTDTELAITLLREKGCGEIWIAGGGGGRIDHLFAIYFLLDGEDGAVCPDRWYTAREEIFCLAEGRALRAETAPGGLVSVFPLQSGPWRAESSGLVWPLAGVIWRRGGLGLSNAAETGPFEIRSVEGRFLVVITAGSVDTGRAVRENRERPAAITDDGNSGGRQYRRGDGNKGTQWRR